MKFDNQLRYGSSVITAYRGEMPLHAWLKSYFREHKQMGSRDRKLISSMVYGFYRLGHAFGQPDAFSATPSLSGSQGLPDTQIRERILAGLFLCNSTPSDLLAYFKPQWNENTDRPPEEKIALYHQSATASGPPVEASPGNAGLSLPAFNPENIFPWKEELSEGIDPSAFCLSFLQQPDLFLRIRPGHEQKVRKNLEEKQPDFEFIPPFTVRLPNGSKAQEWFALNKEVVIQDYSSQRVGDFLRVDNTKGTPSVWDACAASGGKSLLVQDLNPSVELTVSDIRESILHNLRERFREAGIHKYHSFVADLSERMDLAGKRRIGKNAVSADGYDLVIADTPCSGSGVWGRTPEELYFFDRGKIAVYRDLQRKILTNLIPAAKPGGRLVYITCSVFREENEAQVAFIQENSAMTLEKTALIKGYDRGADTLFAARFVAP